MEKVAAAKARVPGISPEEAKALLDDPGTLFIDVRDPDEVRASGKVRGAVNVSRGMLEFRADPASPMHRDGLTPDKAVVVYCGTGGRAALSGAALLDLGYANVRNLGGFKDWVEAGGDVEPVSEG